MTEIYITIMYALNRM